MDALLTKTEKKPAATKQKISGSEVLLRCLVAEKVQHIFGYPGGAIMPVYDALYGYADKLTHIVSAPRTRRHSCRTRLCTCIRQNRSSVCYIRAGGYQLVTGLADALIDSTPVVCITGQVFAHLLGTDAFQEIDVINTTLPVTKWNVQVTEAKDIAPAIAKAFYIAASGRPGPVLVDITKNAQNELIEEFEYEAVQAVRTYKPKPVLQLAQVEAAAN
jgi:acetolactate synthase-1/2/3 large subunit